MAARAIASGTITFGLVSVPVKLYTATRSKTVSFNLLHDKDKSRMRQQYVCGACGEVVERSAMVKGYEYAKDQYVVFSPDELKAFEQQTDQSIDIEEFVPIASIDPLFFGKAYLLGPDKGGPKAYRLLCQAMAKSGQVAVGRFSSRGEQQLIVLREKDGGLVMHSLYYADEVSSFDEIDRGEGATIKEGELDLAIQLISQLGIQAFDATRFKDEYRDKVLAAIEQKVAGQEIAVAPAEAPKAQIIDLMEALKASLDAKRKQPASNAESDERKPPIAKSRPPRKSVAKAR